MSERSDSDADPRVQFINSAMNAIGEGRYRDALAILDEGIGQLVTAAEGNQMTAVLKRLQTMFAYLDYRLEEDFGTDWKTDSTPARQAEIRCSFCGKTRQEVAEIVAGPGVFICNECIKVCDRALAAKHT
jgi:hypothetical protein